MGDFGEVELGRGEFYENLLFCICENFLVKYNYFIIMY